MGVPLDLVQQTSYIDDHDNLNGIQGSKLASSKCSKFFGLSSKAVMQCLASKPWNAELSRACVLHAEQNGRIGFLAWTTQFSHYW